jgi:hypothetical protein
MGLGYRYAEIMEITGASYTAVNRRITEGRRAKLELEREDVCDSRSLRRERARRAERGPRRVAGPLHE